MLELRADFTNLDDKLDFAKEMIKDIPVLLVVDDLDSLDQDRQIELFARLSQLFDQSVSNKGNSKVLFTSRLAPNAGPNRIQVVEGFSDDEAKDYIHVLIRTLGGTNTWGSSVLECIKEVQEASKALQYSLHRFFD